jgi:hypothetical protein
MKQFFACLLALMLGVGDSAPAQNQSAAGAGGVAPNNAPSAAPSPNTLLDGTAVKLRLAENLTSATAKTGQSVSFEVTEDVVVGGVTVLVKGGQAVATVTDANAKKNMGRGGKLDLNIDSARLLDGEKVQLRASQDNKGGGHVGAMTGAMVATSIVFFPAAPLFLFMHGKDVTIPKGTEITAFVEGDMKLDMAKFAAVNAPGAPVILAPTAPAAQTSSLTIDASMPNCDIEVDGNFVGSTPSTLNLPPGKHDIVVKKSGYQDWTRSMMVDGGAVRVSADMVAK